MSNKEEVVGGRICANCSSIDGKLRRCCGEIFYCNVECQKKHRKVHKLMCQNTSISNKKKTGANDKKKVADDLFGVGMSKSLAVDDGYDSFRDEESEIDLVTYEPPPRDDCPLCMCPMPLDNRKIEYMMCCGKRLCRACSLDHATNSITRGVHMDTWAKCVFCRGDRDWGMGQLKAAVKRGDGEGVFLIATSYEAGQNGVPINYQKAVELYHEATKLGNANAAHTLGSSYMSGDIVRMDKEKAKRLLCRAAKGGSIGSLHQLGCMKFEEGNNLDFLAYFFKAAALGWKDSLDTIKRLHDAGLVSEEDYRLTLSDYLDVVKKEQSASRDKVVGNMNKERAQRNQRPI
eukprot:scaffold1887_cov133-Skeletonema_menzelii.AAC.5